MPETTAAVVREYGTPFQIEQITVDDPRPSEILVRMVAAGLCHTDLSAQAGLFPFPVPGVLGHEGAGIVEAVGDAVTGIQPGDKVLLSFISCGRCRSCDAGRRALCEAWAPLNLLAGARPDGSAPIQGADGGQLHGYFFAQSSFSALALADERNAIRVDPDTPLEVLAPLGCGVQTGAGTVFNVLKPAAGASLAVIGAGSVGLSAIMAATLTPATTIIAVDRVPARLALASELGATDTVDVRQADIADALRQITSGRGVDLAIDASGDASAVAAAVCALAVEGTLALVGAPPFGTSAPFDVNWMLPGRSIVGVTEGSSDPHTLIPTLIRLYQQGRLPVDRLVTTYPFADLQTATNDLKAGETIKPVLLFEP